MMSALENLIPELRQERCTHFRYRYSSCNRCIEQCPHQALEVSDKGVSLIPQNCTGCALCSASCPTGVFLARNLPLSDIAKPNAESISIACNPSELEGDIKVPCLGAIDVSILASLKLRNIKFKLKGSHHCSQCAHAPYGEQRLYAILDALSYVFMISEDEAWSLLERDDVKEVSGLDRNRSERRQFFRRWLAQGSELVKNEGQPFLDVPPSAIRYANHYVPARRRMAEKVLNHFNEPISDELSGMTWFVGDVETGEKECTGCEVCARVCPTGALKIGEEDNDWNLIFSSSQCVGCDVCIEACTANAITVSYAWKPKESETQVLYSLLRHRCQGCGRYFIGIQDDACPVCSDDTDNFSAIFG